MENNVFPFRNTLCNNIIVEVIKVEAVAGKIFLLVLQYTVNYSVNQYVYYYTC